MMVAIGLACPLRVVLPHLSFQARAVLDSLWLGGGSVGCATRGAEVLGLRNRFALARMLRREGRPGLRELAAWVSILGSVMATELSSVLLVTLGIASVP